MFFGLIQRGSLYSQIGSFGHGGKQKDWQGEKLRWVNGTADILEFTVSPSN